MRRSLVLLFVLAGCGNEVSGPGVAGLGSPDTVSHGDDDGPPDTTLPPADNDPVTDTDPATDDAPVPPPVPPAACTALICEDFEDALDAAVWTVKAGYAPENAVARESTRVAHGVMAAKAHVANTSGGFAMLEVDAPAALKDVAWGRAYFYTTVATTSGHTGFISANAAYGRMFEIGYGGGTYQLTLYPGDGERPHGSSHNVPRNSWVCLEWRFQRTAPADTNYIEVYIDGILIETYAADFGARDAMTSFSLGIDDHSANSGDNDVYLDDVAIDDARIGCLSN